MSLVKCKECGKDVSTKAKECPNCGCSVAYTTKLRWYFWVPLLVVIVMVFVYSNLPDTTNLETIETISTSSSEPVRYSSADPIATSAPEEKLTPEMILSRIKARCARKWSDNYGMQEHCNKSEQESMSSIAEIYNANPKGSEAHSIISRCLSKWKEGVTYNYGMVEHCTNSEIDSYNKLYGN